jgi:hypothetical protein
MDPDETLRLMRQAITRWEGSDPYSQAEHDAGLEVTSAAGALDEYLSNGGFPPQAWSDKLIRDLREQNAELRTQLNQAQGTNLILCPEREVYRWQREAVDASPGTILRATDTGNEWEFDGLNWTVRAR